MKKLAMTAVTLMILGSNAARADGFVCQTVEGDLNVKVYNHVRATSGTRNGSIMILSDPAVAQGRKTIASFSDVNTTLANSGASYVAKVDLRFSESRRAGELIAGTRLGQLDQVKLDIDFSYGSPVDAEETLTGSLTLEKRNGDVLGRDVVCTRYLKGE